MIPLNVFRGTFTSFVLLIVCVPANCEHIFAHRFTRTPIVVTQKRVVPDPSVKCHTPVATLSKEASLTCHFPEDISVSKKDFTVYHYVKHGLPDSVVDCFWVRGVLQCLVREGFRFDKVVTNQMTVHIPHTMEKHAGKYTCQMSGNVASDIAPCHLHINKEPTVKCHISEEQGLKCYFPEDIGQTKKNFTVHHHAKHHAETLLHCFWNREKMHCTVRGGFSYDHGVTDQITLRIPNPTDKHMGKYTCHMTGTSESDIAPCHFHLTTVSPPNKRSEWVSEVPIFSSHSAGGDLWSSMQKAILLVMLVFHIYLFKN